MRRTRIRYRTERGRRCQVAVFASAGSVCLAFDDGTRLHLRGLDIGRLRAALRDKVILAAEHPDLDELHLSRRRGAS